MLIAGGPDHAMPAKVTILGSGSMATACAIVLAEHPETSISIWARDEHSASELRRTRGNAQLPPNVRIPDRVEITHEIRQAAAGADFLFVAIPSQYLRLALSPIAEELKAPIPAISVVKGIENETFLRPSEIIQDVLGPRPVIALVGPSHAEEIGRRMPASVVAACEDPAIAKQVQDLISTDRFRVYTNTDLIGAELAGALKNVIAIAAGICDGLGYGDNAKSALITRGIIEITRFGVALGAEPATFAGLAGLGDLITTCTSQHGRNRRVGERLGRGETLAQIIASSTSVAEGISTTRAVHHLAKSKGIDMPITEQIYRVLFEGTHPEEATEVLMSRPTGEE